MNTSRFLLSFILSTRRTFSALKLRTSKLKKERKKKKIEKEKKKEFGLQYPFTFDLNNSLPSCCKDRRTLKCQSQVFTEAIVAAAQEGQAPNADRAFVALCSQDTAELRSGCILSTKGSSVL